MHSGFDDISGPAPRACQCPTRAYCIECWGWSRRNTARPCAVRYCILYMTQLLRAEGSICQDDCRRDFLHLPIASPRDPLLSAARDERTQGPLHSTLFCSFPRCILTSMKTRFAFRACCKHKPHRTHLCCAYSEHAARLTMIQKRTEEQGVQYGCLSTIVLQSFSSTTPSISAGLINGRCSNSILATQHNEIQRDIASLGA